MIRTSLAVVLGVCLAVVLATTAAGSEVSWTPAHELAPAGLSYPIAGGDLDGDGDDDIADFGYRDMYWNIGWPSPPNWQLEEDALLRMGVFGCNDGSGTLGDIDADGDLDLVYGCWECCSFRMVWNVGTPQAPAWEYGGAIAGDPSAGYSARACLADVDADGDFDLVATNAAGAIGIYENTGTPEGPYWVWLGLIPGIGFGASGGQLAVGDLDGDGDLDIVGGSSSSQVKCWENVGTPQAWSYVRNDAMLTGVDDPMDGVYGITLPDVDCDGDCDLLIVGGGGAVYLHLNEQITSARPESWGVIKGMFREPVGQVSPN